MMTLDAMAIVASNGPGDGSANEGAAQKPLNAVIVEVNPQTLPIQLRMGRCRMMLLIRNPTRPGDQAPNNSQ